MNYFTVTFSLNSSVDQTQVIQLLKSQGAEVIQTSSGLCVKSSQVIADLKAALGEVAITQINPLRLPADTPRDVLAFLSVQNNPETE